MRRRLLAVLVVCIALLAAESARTGGRVHAQSGEQLTVHLATVDQGDQVWEKFGHNAIWIRDASTGSTISYNYGIFAFDQPGFVPRLMAGRMRYNMGVFAAEDELAHYTRLGRSVTVQRLNLTAAQKLALREFLEWNWTQNEGEYLYDYFLDNCSTRLRDALDRALGGQLRPALAATPAGSTYRSESLRLTAASLGTYVGLLIGLGRPTDRPLDAWEESFIPMRLQQHLRTVEVLDADGRPRPLVAEETTLFAATRPPAPTGPPVRWPWFLAAGLLAAGALVALAYAARGRPLARMATAVLMSLWGVVTGFLGVILALLWLFTDHHAAYPNLNLLQLNPLALVLAVAAPLAIGGRPARFATARLALPLALLLAGIAALGLLLLPVAGQANGALIALLLPVHLAVVLCLYRLRPAAPSPPEDAPAGMRLRAAA